MPGAGEVPVEHPGEATVVDHPVVGPAVVVAHDLVRTERPRDTPPVHGALRPVGLDLAVVGPQPGRGLGEHQVRRRHLVRVVHLAGQVRQHLPAALVAAEHPRHARQRGARQVPQQVVHGAGPRAGGPAHGRPDAYGAADVASWQPLAVEQPRPERLHEADLAGQPVDVAELLRCQPAHRVVLGRHRLALDQPADVRAQQPPLGDRDRVGQLLADLDGAAQLLGHLSRQRLLGRLPRLHLAAGQLPPAGEPFRRHPARGQQSPVPDDGGPHDGAHPRHRSAPRHSVTPVLRAPCTSGKVGAAQRRARGANLAKGPDAKERG